VLRAGNRRARDSRTRRTDSPPPLFLVRDRSLDAITVAGEHETRRDEPSLAKAQRRSRLQSSGLDVIDDLRGTCDLTNPTVRANIPTYDVGSSPLVEWTAAKASLGYSMTGITYTCVTNTSGSFIPQVITPPHVYCKP
jgi:hypothetical protein